MISVGPKPRKVFKLSGVNTKYSYLSVTPIGLKATGSPRIYPCGFSFDDDPKDVVINASFTSWILLSVAPAFGGQIQMNVHFKSYEGT